MALEALLAAVEYGSWLGAVVGCVVHEQGTRLIHAAGSECTCIACYGVGIGIYKRERARLRGIEGTRALYCTGFCLLEVRA